jgi:hypothetical protein
VGSPVDRCFKLFLSIVLSASGSSGGSESGSPISVLRIVVSSRNELVGYCKNLLIALALLCVWVEGKQSIVRRMSLPPINYLLGGNLGYSWLMMFDGIFIIAVPPRAVLAGWFV